MSKPAQTLDDLWDVYLKYRTGPIPGGGAFMSVISQGEILDVQDFFRKEFDAIIQKVQAEAIRNATQACTGTGPSDPADGVVQQLEHYANWIEGIDE